MLICLVIVGFSLFANATKFYKHGMLRLGNQNLARGMSMLQKPASISTSGLTT